MCFSTVREGHSRAQGNGQAVLICWTEMVNLDSGTVVLFSMVWPCRFAAKRGCKLQMVKLLAGFCV